MPPAHTEKTSICGVAANVIAAASYMVGFVTGIVVLFAEKENRFVRFHAMQSTIFFGVVVLLDVLLQVIPLLGFLLVIFLVIPASAVVWLLMMYKAYQGEEYKLPIVGQWAADRIG
jgi:uncharacterized membrane protein